ncbi:MAG: polyphosphate polymerase domain-containing protein [Aeromicrobium sp.]
MTARDSRAVVADSVGLLEPIGLDELMRQAGLQTRVDRKYLVPPEVLAKVVAELGGGLRVLEIDRSRQFGYQSVYFDTADYRCFHDHLQGRRRRFKVRTRCYLDTGECQLEVKMKGGRSETVKSRLPYHPDDAFSLTSEGRRFVMDLINEAQTGQQLRPVLMSQYKRTTLIDVQAQTRMTCDVQLEWVSARSETGDLVKEILVETKTKGPAGEADRLFRSYGYRPISISKYCLGVALLNPELRANPWHRTLRRHFDWAPPARSLEGLSEAS